jgi:hypothetical protein
MHVYRPSTPEGFWSLNMPDTPVQDNLFIRGPCRRRPLQVPIVSPPFVSVSGFPDNPPTSSPPVLSTDALAFLPVSPAFVSYSPSFLSPAIAPACVVNFMPASSTYMPHSPDIIYDTPTGSPAYPTGSPDIIFDTP